MDAPTPSCGVDHESTDRFRPAFKHYKSRNPPPDLKLVLDFDKPTPQESLHILPGLLLLGTVGRSGIIHEGGDTGLVKPGTDTGDKGFFRDAYEYVLLSLHSAFAEVDAKHPDADVCEGLILPAQWKMYGHKKLPGFTFIRNPFQSAYQRYWVKRCLEDYPEKPSHCNLDAHMELPKQQNIWRESLADTKSETSLKHSLVGKLRWVTLGYHHNWDTKEYAADNFTPLPEDLSSLCQCFASVLGYSDYTTEAAIINFYHRDSTLSGHTDHSEPDKEAPLFSISFGQTAIFLLGGVTKETEPVAMYLRSGDIVIISKETRLAYHAVPKILTAKDAPGLAANSLSCFDLPKAIAEEKAAEKTGDSAGQKFCSKLCCCDEECMSEKRPRRETSATCYCAVNRKIRTAVRAIDWQPFHNYLTHSRINMNVRQVLPKGKTFSDFCKEKQ